MKLLAIVSALISLILSVRATTYLGPYECKVAHQHFIKKFTLKVNQEKTFSLADWTLTASIKKRKFRTWLELKRDIQIMGATYEKKSIKSYPAQTIQLRTTLAHQFGGKIDHFKMLCSPLSD